jgi:hypothetical protein
MPSEKKTSKTAAVSAVHRPLERGPSEIPIAAARRAPTSRLQPKSTGRIDYVHENNGWSWEPA